MPSRLIIASLPCWHSRPWLSARGKLPMPILVLSADQGSIADMAAPLRTYAEEVRGGVVANCGHFIPEEQPEAAARELGRVLQ